MSSLIVLLLSTAPLSLSGLALHPKFRSAIWKPARRGLALRSSLGEEGKFKDAKDELSGPKFRTTLDEDDAGPTATAGRSVRRRRARMNDRLAAEIAELEQALPIRESEVPEQKVAPIMGYKEDLVQINPIFALLGSGFLGAVAYGSWEGTQWLANFFGTHPLDEDTFYVVQRIATVVRTVVVASVALFAGIAGMTGMGLFALGLRVTAGTLTGEFKADSKATGSRKPPPEAE
eukprot:CAMPEP_0172596480 /NCGR_PEP_ID=MMETSP1068-20121228/16291_1 /TAXON_ID=35684 /ORGANISM="Pseudopedinella elastica, Strain CCMP716" /LENGTH=232 /DNA_ID=CAMNT_0013395529 /DNA_START=44 /DNA_END=742 /DNA_ORIENTATION=-